MKKYRRNKRYYYFRKQKICGAIVAALGVLSAIILNGDITAALLLVPLGLYVMFTKEKVLMDDYYYECKAKECDKWTDL
jgi:hypothetical protein